MTNQDKTIQSAMLGEMQDKQVFERAQRYGLAYLDEVLQRNVYPTEQALSDLSHFDEEFPDGPADAEDVNRSVGSFAQALEEVRAVNTPHRTA